MCFFYFPFSFKYCKQNDKTEDAICFNEKEKGRSAFNSLLVGIVFHEKLTSKKIHFALKNVWKYVLRSNPNPKGEPSPIPTIFGWAQEHGPITSFYICQIFTRERSYGSDSATLYAFAGPTPPSTSIHGFTPCRKI